MAATQAIRGYVFRARQSLRGGSSDQGTALTGRAVRPSSIAYTVTIGATTQQVVRIGGRSYLRVPPAGWKALDKPGPVVDPLASLPPLLTNLTHRSLAGQRLTGEVSAVALTEAHLAPNGSTGGATAPISFALDTAGRVVSVDLRLSVLAGSRRLELDETTAFSNFDRVTPITAPGVIVPAR